MMLGDGGYVKFAFAFPKAMFPSPAVIEHTRSAAMERDNSNVQTIIIC